MTGFEGETSEHSRDAGMLVFGKNTMVGVEIAEIKVTAKAKQVKDGRCGLVKNAIG